MSGPTILDLGLGQRDTAWRQHAACLDVDPGVFYPDEGPMPKARRLRLIRRAKAICATCPVTQPCLEDALLDRAYEDQGIRGCTTEDERRVIRRERGQTVHLSMREKREDPEYRQADAERRQRFREAQAS